VRRSALGVVVPAAVVLGLVGIVAIAAGGSTSTGGPGSRAPAATLVDTILSLGVVALVPGAVLLIYGLTQRQAIAREMAAAKRFRRLSFTGFVLFMLLFSVATYFRMRNWRNTPAADDAGEQGFPGPGQLPPAGEGQVHQAEFAWIPVLVVLAVVGVGVVAYWLSARSRRELGSGERELAGEVAEAVDESLDDLRAETDARRAVIAAYARLERALARSGLPRFEYETVEEYVARILDRLEVDQGLVRRLTDLFTRAKFSRHDVDETMRDVAIEALAGVRDQLRAAAEARAEEAARVRAHHRQPAPS
jgi:Domain of unknown function (DUF4129)